MIEVTLKDPGLVENDTDGTSCFLACSQMVMRTKVGGKVLSFDELSKIIRRKEGEYSWEYAILNYLGLNNFDVKFVSTFDLRRFVGEKEKYMYEYFGKEAAEDQIVNSNMENAYADALSMIENTSIDIDNRVPNIDDIKDLINDGFYLIPYINQRMFQADPGYVAHTIVVYGYSERGVRLHNPGPPATGASEVSWDLFMKAWSSPSEEARILFAVRPSS